MSLDSSSVISLVSSFLVCLGYAPEFYRLWTAHASSFSSSTNLHMWCLWVSSSFLSMVYAIVAEAPILVICNITLIFALTFLALLGNAFRIFSARRFRLQKISAEDECPQPLDALPSTPVVDFSPNPNG